MILGLEALTSSGDGERGDGECGGDGERGGRGGDGERGGRGGG